MAEAIGLALGVGGLAGLFGATVDAFDQIRAAKSFSRNYEILSTRYDMRRAALLQWGTAVGLGGDETHQMQPKLSDSTLQPLVERALRCIKMLLTDTDDLQAKYGLQQVQIQTEDEADSNLLLGTSLSRQRLRNFKSSYNRFRANIRDRQKNTSIMRKTQWAIFDSNDFRQLLEDLGGLIDDLYKLVPVSLSEQARLIEEDASALPNDIEHVRLVEAALAEDEASKGLSDLSHDHVLFSMPEEAFFSSWKPGTVPPTASFMDGAASQLSLLHSPAFASVASSNASWVTALSHRASLIDSHTPVKFKTLRSSTQANPSFRVCSSVQKLLHHQLEIEDVFRKALPLESCETADVAFWCKSSGCEFHLPFRRGESDLDANTSKVYYSHYTRHQVVEILAFRASLLAKSHMCQASTTRPDLAEYCCLICELLRPDSTDGQVFTAGKELLRHVASHAGETISGTTLCGSMSFFSSGFSRSVGNFDIDFLGVEPLDINHHTTSQSGIQEDHQSQFDATPQEGESVKCWRARKREADEKQERQKESERKRQEEFGSFGEFGLSDRVDCSEWDLDRQSVWGPKEPKIRPKMKSGIEQVRTPADMLRVAIIENHRKTRGQTHNAPEEKLRDGSLERLRDRRTEQERNSTGQSYHTIEHARPNPANDPGIVPSISSPSPDEGTTPIELDIFLLSPVAALEMLCHSIDTLVSLTGDIPPRPLLRSRGPSPLHLTFPSSKAAPREDLLIPPTEPEHIDDVLFNEAPIDSPKSHHSEPTHPRVVGEHTLPVAIQLGNIARKFYSKRPPPISISEYLLRMHKYCPMSTAVYLATLCYITRIAVVESILPLTPLNVHRLLLAGLRVAMKALEDLSWPHARFSKVGGVSEAALRGLEISFCFLMNFDLKVSTEMLERKVLSFYSQMKHGQDSPLQNSPASLGEKLAGEKGVGKLKMPEDKETKRKASTVLPGRPKVEVEVRG